MKQIKILVVDDHSIVRQGLKQILADSQSLIVAGEASTGQEALQKIRSSNFDMVIMDISLPDRSGLDMLEQIKIIAPKLPVLILSMHAEEQYATRAFKSGASGYLTKESASEQLVIAINKVAQGGKYISPSLAEKLVFELVKDSEKALHESLSDRELQVLCLLASGKTLTDISQALHVSVKTVSTYRTRILEKMGMHNNAELIRYALENKLVI
ncbi:MAG: response regulator transcription factor [Blastocatellia bacterium]|nr:response regulator transcription factor [Blastocatellia bacterium]MBL8195251.1 response regulator transcription factor [Blastocatellia bacterium]MBN8724053.1 response regulator transcription factor [Acidobacteriota bacterium]